MANQRLAQAYNSLSTQFAPMDSDLGVEAYLYCSANQPHNFISLTSNPSEDLHSPPASPTSEPLKTKGILKATSTNPTLSPAPVMPVLLQKQQPQQQRQKPTVSFTTPIQTPMQRNPSISSSDDANTATIDHEDELLDRGYLGGGALRHVAASHHLNDLAVLHASHPPEPKHMASSGSTRKPVKMVHEEHADEASWLHVMDWWPETMDMMEHEWTDDFYE